MINGPELWDEILGVAREFGQNPVIAGGAIRDYVLGLGAPKDIDVFIGGVPPDEMQLPENWIGVMPDIRADAFISPEYHGQIGTINAIQNWRSDISPAPIQFIWIGDVDPIQYVRRFDLGTSKCYYRNSMVLGRDFLHDWHNRQITILAAAYEHPRNIERSRERARSLRPKWEGSMIIENDPDINIAIPFRD